VLSAIYCFAIITATKSLESTSDQDFSSSTKEKVFSGFTTKLIAQSPQSETVVTNINQLPDLNLKNPFTGFGILVKETGELIETTFSQYTNLSRNFLVQYRKKDTIFPFHYFW